MKAPNANAWRLWASELIGTAALVAAGGSLVVIDFAPSSPVVAGLPEAAARRALTGLLFGSVGALIAISPVGRTSGAHINPVVTLAFWLERRMASSLALGYVVAQLAGGVIGALPLRLWGGAGASVAYGATVPGPNGVWAALAGEVATTFCLIAALFAVLCRPRLRGLAPALFPPLYALMVWLEAPLSGTSTNPARSLGPALVAGALGGWWIYFVGPALGALGAVALRHAPWVRPLEIQVAKVFHFHHDPYGIFAAHAPRAPSGGRAAG